MNWFGVFEIRVGSSEVNLVYRTVVSGRSRPGLVECGGLVAVVWVARHAPRTYLQVFIN